MVGSINASVAGLEAAAKRVAASANNIAHAQDTIATERAQVDPVRAPAPVGGAEAADLRRPYRPVDVVQVTGEDGAPRAIERPRDPPHELAYRPDDPVADENGLVARPRVDLATEQVNLIAAQRAYEASLNAFKTRDEIIGITIDARS